MTTNEQKQVDRLRLFILENYQGTVDLNPYLKDDELLNSIKKCSIEQLEYDITFELNFQTSAESLEYIKENGGLDTALECVRNYNSKVTIYELSAWYIARVFSMYNNQDKWDDLAPNIITTIEFLNEEL